MENLIFMMICWGLGLGTGMGLGTALATERISKYYRDDQS